MTQKEINIIIEEHKKWLNDNGGKRANLWRANLQGVNLWEANLRGAYLWEANLQGANLQEADLQEADLQGANLRGAYLQGAYLREADLWEANLRGAYLWEADLQGANLRRANLWEADLWEANLRGAYLRGAYLRGANLWRANLRGAEYSPFSIIPEEGSFIGWKKCENHILKLEIPEDAQRTSSLVGRKCRASKVKVLEIMNLKGEKCADTQAIGQYSKNTVYELGEMVYPDKFDDSILVECTRGIHFFITKQEALGW